MSRHFGTQGKDSKQKAKYVANNSTNAAVSATLLQLNQRVLGRFLNLFDILGRSPQ